MISIKIPLRIMNLFISKEKFVPQSICLLEGEGIETLFGKILFENGSMLLGASLKTNVALKSSILLTTIHNIACAKFYLRLFISERDMLALNLLVRTGVFVGLNTFLLLAFT